MKIRNYEMNEEIIRQSQVNSTKIHLKLKDGSWRNGLVISCSESSFEFIDNVNGVEALFYIQIEKITPFTSGGTY